MPLESLMPKLQNDGSMREMVEGASRYSAGNFLNFGLGVVQGWFRGAPEGTHAPLPPTPSQPPPPLAPPRPPHQPPPTPHLHSYIYYY